MQLAIQHVSVDTRRPRLEVVRATSAKDIEGARAAGRYARHYRAAA